MKTNFFFSALAVTLILCGTTSCKKENVTPDATLISEQTRQEMLTNLIGTWQVAEKGVEVAMHDGHICTDPTMVMDKMTYIVKWDKVANDDTRTFKSNGDFNHYENAILTCQGTYTVSNHAVLEINSACPSSFERIEALTPTLLTIGVGTFHYKFTKLD